MAVARDQGGIDQPLAVSRRWPAEGNRLWLSARWLLEFDCGELGPDPERDEVVDDIASLPRDVFWLPTMSWLGEVVAATGSEAQAGTMYEQLAPFAALWIQLVFDGSFGTVARPLGLLAGRLGRSDLAGGHLRDAIDRHAAASAPALEARACADLAVAIEHGSAEGSPGEAAALLARARALAAGCGAQRLTERLAHVEVGVRARASEGSARG
jgi:hypothetical protein